MFDLMFKFETSLTVNLPCGPCYVLSMSVHMWRVRGSLYPELFFSILLQCCVIYVYVRCEYYVNCLPILN